MKKLICYLTALLCLMTVTAASLVFDLPAGSAGMAVMAEEVDEEDIDEPNVEEWNFDGAHYKYNKDTCILVISGTGVAHGVDYPLKGVVLSEGISGIADNAFMNCTGIKGIEIPGSVRYIGECAFAHCYGLVSITVPESVKEIRRGAFWDCTGLSAVNICSGVETIGESAFSGCVALKSVSIPDSVTVIGKYSFLFCSGMTGVTFGQGVKAIDGYAFAGCSKLPEAALPESLETLGDGAFLDCVKLESVSVPDSVVSIGANAFKGCSSVKEITLGESLSEIPASAFEDCVSLRTATLPVSLKRIGENAFKASDIRNVYYRGSESQFDEIETAAGNEILLGADFHFGRTFVLVITRSNNVYSTGKPRIEWEPDADAVKYQIFCSDSADGEYRRIANAVKPGSTDNSAVCGSTYYYKVRSVYADGTYGPFTASPIEITCKPARPTAKASVDGASGAPVITWTEAADADKYQVYRSTEENGKYVRTDFTELLTSTDTSAVIGCSYYYKVRSVDVNGVAGAFSSKLLVTAGKLPRPSASGTNVKATGKPRLTWLAVEGAAKYQVYRASTIDGKYTKIGTPTSLGQTDNSAVSGKGYYYKVRAVNSVGTAGAFSSIIYIVCK